MKSELVTIAPAMEAFTSTYCPARSAANAMRSSVRLPSVAFSRPPIRSPVLTATDSVARLSRAANGTIAATERRNRSVCASGRSSCATSTTGTRTRSHNNGVWRISSKRGVIWLPHSMQGPSCTNLDLFSPVFPLHMVDFQVTGNSRADGRKEVGFTELGEQAKPLQLVL